MKTRTIPVICLFLLSGLSLFGQDKTIPSRLTEATVFFEGAELTHTANTNLAKGESVISIEGLSPQIDMNSLKVKTTNRAIISSYEFSIDYMTSAKEATPVIRKLKDSVSYYEGEVGKIKIAQDINLKMIAFLQSGTEKNISGSEQGLGIDDLVKTMEYYKGKAEELQKERITLEKKRTDLDTSLKRVKKQLAQESVKGNKTSGVLKLTLSAPMAGNTDFTISYFTGSASWVPYYDVNIASTDLPIAIAMKSKVRQTTGLDWEKIRLSLSTAAPSNGKIAPLFSAWFLRPVTAASPRSSSRKMMQNAYSYDAVEEVGIVDAVMMRGAQPSSASPVYIVDGVMMNDLDNIDQSLIKDIEVLPEASAKSLYGSRAAGGVMIVTLKSEMDDFITTSDNELNVSYNIDLPYTIPGNGKVQTIDLNTQNAEATYKYYCAPKLDTETYVLAEIPNWQKLGLLSGTANVTYGDTYVGATYIDASSTQSKLTLTLGTDRRVVVKRELLQDYSSTRSLGSDTQQIFTYQLTVKNNQSRAITMVLKDQYPISTEKNISVELRKETTDWTARIEDTGVITWEEEFAPGETKTYQISYSVKYPKNVRLNL